MLIRELTIHTTPPPWSLNPFGNCLRIMALMECWLASNIIELKILLKNKSTYFELYKQNHPVACVLVAPKKYIKYIWILSWLKTVTASFEIYQSVVHPLSSKLVYINWSYYSLISSETFRWQMFGKSNHYAMALLIINASTITLIYFLKN